jgi:hypothetical protein
MSFKFINVFINPNRVKVKKYCGAASSFYLITEERVVEKVLICHSESSPEFASRPDDFRAS